MRGRGGHNFLRVKMVGHLDGTGHSALVTVTHAVCLGQFLVRWVRAAKVVPLRAKAEASSWVNSTMTSLVSGTRSST